jgi:molybdopterin-guanine dinucleotide biosynthesis protein A
MTRAAGVVLAGGQASRMGKRNKALLKVGGLPLIERVVIALAPLVSRVIIVANDPAPFRYLGLETIPDALGASGALAGLLAGLLEARQPVLATGCDLPFISGPLAMYLMENLPGWDAVVPKCPEGLQPLFAVYGPGCVEPVRKAVDLGEHRITGFYRGLSVRYVEGPELAPFEPDRAFFNINTPADLALARKMAESELLYSNSRAYNGEDG